MSDLNEAAQWLHRMSEHDDDVRAALHQAYRRVGTAHLGELCRDEPELVIGLYEGLKDMVESVEAMDAWEERANAAARRGRALASNPDA